MSDAKEERLVVPEGDEFKCIKDGNAWICFGKGFINLQESDNYVYADTEEEAIIEFGKLELEL